MSKTDKPTAVPLGGTAQQSVVPVLPPVPPVQPEPAMQEFSKSMEV